MSLPTYFFVIVDVEAVNAIHPFAPEALFFDAHDAFTFCKDKAERTTSNRLRIAVIDTDDFAACANRADVRSLMLKKSNITIGAFKQISEFFFDDEQPTN